MTSQTENSTIRESQGLWCIKFDTVNRDKVSEGAAIRQKIENCCREAGVAFPSTLLVPTDSSLPVLITYDHFKDEEELKKQVMMERASAEVANALNEAESQMSDHEFSRGIYLNEKGCFPSATNYYLVVRISCDKAEKESLLQRCQKVWERFAEMGVEPGVTQKVSDDFRSFNKPPEIIWTIGCETAEEVKKRRAVLEEEKEISPSEQVNFGEYTSI